MLKLRDVLSEMSMPTIQNEEQAVKAINQAYTAAVVKKSPEGDFLGPLQAALKFLQSSTSPEKYATEVKKGIAAMNAIKKYSTNKSANQAKFTTNRGA